MVHEVVVEVDVGAGPRHDPATSELLGLDQPASQSAVSIYILDQSEVSMHTLLQSEVSI